MAELWKCTLSMLGERQCRKCDAVLKTSELGLYKLALPCGICVHVKIPARITEVIQLWYEALTQC